MALTVGESCGNEAISLTILSVNSLALRSSALRSSNEIPQNESRLTVRPKSAIGMLHSGQESLQLQHAGTYHARFWGDRCCFRQAPWRRPKLDPLGSAVSRRACCYGYTCKWTLKRGHARCLSMYRICRVYQQTLLLPPSPSSIPPPLIKL